MTLWIRCGATSVRTAPATLSSIGRWFDIGNAVRRALEQLERAGDAYAGPADPLSAGNGSIIRLAPVPMFFAADLDVAISMSAEGSGTTHQAEKCPDACRLLGGLIALALRGTSKDERLGGESAILMERWKLKPLSSRITEDISRSFPAKVPLETRERGMGRFLGQLAQPFAGPAQSGTH